MNVKGCEKTGPSVGTAAHKEGFMSKDEYKSLIIELLDKIDNRKFMKQMYTIISLHISKAEK